MAFCRWAGLRLPTEFEYQHAARGSSKDRFPWGDEWEDGKYCATNEIRRVSRTYPVGKFPEGVSRDGIHDLAGNVWERTASPYLAYPKFKKNQYRIPGSRKKYAVPQPKWDGNQRIIVGGSFANSKMVARCTVRRGSERSQMTEAVGFRVAGTPLPCKDVVDLIWMQDLRNADARPSGVSYTTGAVMGQDRWHVAAGAAGAPTGYGVITGYEYLAFVPVEQLEITSDVDLGKASRIAPFHLGFVSLSMSVVEPVPLLKSSVDSNVGVLMD